MDNMQTIHNQLFYCLRELNKVRSLFSVCPDKDFSRNRSLDFIKTIATILGFQGKTLDKELIDIGKPVTSSALVQRRGKILSEAFYYLCKCQALFYPLAQVVQLLQATRVPKSPLTESPSRSIPLLPRCSSKASLRRCAMLKDAVFSSFAGVYLVYGYTDMRYGIDSLAAIIEQRYKMDLFVPNTLFLFCGHSSSKIKGLLWEGDGFLLLYKRVESGRFSWPRRQINVYLFHTFPENMII